MIEVLEAIEFKGKMEGGSTMPWQITALQNGVPIPYVVKLYKTQHNDENHTVLKECICSLLAKQFDFATPDIALINFSESFISSLPNEFKIFLQGRDPRIKFASRLIEAPYENYSPALQSQYIESFDICSIYAFDNMILNIDRKVAKPNMFFKDKKVLLIDHELTLVTVAEAQECLTKNMPWGHNYKRHIFHSVIQEMTNSDKNNCFDTFDLYLRDVANFDNLDFLVDLLTEYDHPVEAFFNIKSYLHCLKNNPSRYLSLLTDTIK